MSKHRQDTAGKALVDELSGWKAGGIYGQTTGEKHTLTHFTDMSRLAEKNTVRQDGRRANGRLIGR